MKKQFLTTLKKVIVFTTLSLFFWGGLSLIIFSIANALKYILTFIAVVMVIKFFHYMSDDILKFWGINNKKRNY